MQHCPDCGGGEIEIIAAILRGDREDAHPPGAGSVATAPGADARAVAPSDFPMRVQAHAAAAGDRGLIRRPCAAGSAANRR
jgi:hypothetical protein